MPANLPKEALAAAERYQNARTLEEKIRALEEYISKIPKHKGTEKLLAQLKSKLAKLRAELQEERRRRRGRGISYNIPKEGHAQVVLVGLPNSGKSSLLRALTGADVIVADYPFSTSLPHPGMFEFENVMIQIIDLPPIVEGASAGRGIGNWVFGLIRNADAIVLVLDCSQDLEYQLRILEFELRSSGIRLNEKKPEVWVERTSQRGIEIRGKQNLLFDESDAIRILHEFGIHNAVVVVNERVTMDKFVEALDESIVYKKALIVINKADISRKSNLLSFKEKYGRRYPMVTLSSLRITEDDKRRFFETLFGLLGLIRVYTKAPGEEPRLDAPLVLREGSTVEDVARRIHKDLVRRFKYARVWGSAKHPGAKVGLDYVLRDGDIVEIHAK